MIKKKKQIVNMKTKISVMKKEEHGSTRRTLVVVVTQSF